MTYTEILCEAAHVADTRDPAGGWVDYNYRHITLRQEFTTQSSWDTLQGGSLNV